MLSSLTLAAMLTVAADSIPCDLVLKNATLFDGTGSPGVRGDLGIRGETIVAMGEFSPAPTAKGMPKIIDCSNWYIAPGFIDLHTHCDTGSPGLTEPRGRANRCYTTQGVTTVVTGNCGSGPTSIEGFYSQLADGGVATNVAHLVPHNSVRREVMGNVNRPPTAAELARMQALVETGMKQGAWGMATGLIYNPGTYSQTAELIELAKVVQSQNGIYASHIRDEGTGLLDAISEAIRIGREAKLPVHISHIKASGRKAWGKSADAIGMIREAQSKGQIITADQYPYIASSTSLSATVVDARFREGTSTDYRNRFDNPELLPKIRASIAANLEGKKRGETILIARFRHQPRWQGKRLSEIAAEQKRDVVDIVLEIETHGGAQIVNFSMNDEDMRLYMKQPFVATASDGSTQVPSDTVPHPRSYGTFPRKIGRFAIGEKLIPVEQAIRSASGLPADVLRLPNRGYLKVGFAADIVVLDPKTYRDQATFEKPHQFSTGVVHLFVNGQPVIEDSKETGQLPGRPLVHQAKPTPK
ncbi:N-acyl-D-amino-acid deacylase family protein [Tuwongella immobilis]|uniref:Amidohydrolase 3 domain-containing protein n=1 Tax=Tuwongella immobilis TaxID=692036 RepID=A0A6C2YMJ1_9BACT|nr:amidohydrolase family protein [Tuwongella immobilis]VIP02132.1 n-acyl-d-amino-acid deacylase : Uncharacterized protein OS=Planctomyces maris DSM 8797 GN=PM8797T_25491 PE=4 SV=1: Amidohydro_5: Amidohydro_3: D-aminoacyl_C [Tuwongella immobilis]VTS00482.1 n-acyl-d-amino-acid deacylase : Uncharacterized protein OS=Planctomyces maris DSM 8797 GN=PM8797T_25491 PE=4 SV=1: Amidohydro_5: Amidohydro_3: D-aminoacyl_C [Tuwongella immobilis]